jgi:hypothetical protein
VEDFNLLKTLSDYGIGALFGGVILYLSRRDHADMLRREQQFSASLEAMMVKYMELQEKTVEANTRLERQIHELKNMIQRLVFALQQAFPTMRPSGEDKPSV